MYRRARDLDTGADNVQDVRMSATLGTKRCVKVKEQSCPKKRALFVGLAVIVDVSGVTCKEQLFYVFNVFARFFEECGTFF